MAKARVGDLEITQDLAFQRRSWAVQRIGWALMAILLLAAMAGAFGRGGPFASATADAGDGALRVEYERFPHHEAPMTLRLRFGADAVRGGEVRLWIERPYLEKMTVEHVEPEPRSVVLDARRITYVFAARDAAAVTFELKANDFGPMHGRAGVEGGPELAFRQFVYP